MKGMDPGESDEKVKKEKESQCLQRTKNECDKVHIIDRYSHKLDAI